MMPEQRPPPRHQTNTPSKNSHSRKARVFRQAGMGRGTRLSPWSFHASMSAQPQAIDVAAVRPAWPRRNGIVIDLWHHLGAGERIKPFVNLGVGIAKGEAAGAV